METRKQKYCKHYHEEAKKTSVYTYRLIGCDLNLCKKCERKLRKQMLEQIKAEDYVDKYHKKWKKK